MSNALYATRLVWDGRQGIAKLHGREVRLTAKPEIHGLEFASIDYVPEIGCWLLRPIGDRERDLTGEEVRRIDHYLAKLCKVP